jgi:hypothetical protein
MVGGNSQCPFPFFVFFPMSHVPVATFSPLRGGDVPQSCHDQQGSALAVRKVADSAFLRLDSPDCVLHASNGLMGVMPLMPVKAETCSVRMQGIFLAEHKGGQLSVEVVLAGHPPYP